MQTRSKFLILLVLAFGAAIQPIAVAQLPGSTDDGAAQQETQSPQVDPTLQEKLKSPRSTMRTFLRGVIELEWNDAVACLDLSELTPDAAAITGPVKASKLKGIIDRLWLVRYEDLPDDPDAASPYVLAPGADQGVDSSALVYGKQIRIARGEDGLWRFSQETIAAIDDLWKQLEDRPVVEGAEPVEHWILQIERMFPSQLRQTHFLIPTSRWILLLVLIFIGFVADLLVRIALNQLARTWFRFMRDDVKYQGDLKLWRPVGLLAQALVWYSGISLIELPDLAMVVLLAGLKLFSVVAGIWTGFRLIDLLAGYLSERAKDSASKFDDLLVPLVQKSLKIFVVCVGVLTCAQAFSLPIAGLLGGLGIGGAALAFASKDAVSNVFGSITVLTDRPFEIGDWIKTEGIEGSVETVGFRSTRIRTFYNSQITLPNSRLTTAVVDNMGRRQYRRISTTLGVQYDTTPEQIEAFCEGIRELIRRHAYTRKDYYHVYFNSYGDSSLGIMLYCFLECPDWSIELREKHRLFIDILKLAEQLGVSFAFPTRTLHMYQEDAAAAPPDIDAPEQAGQRLAASIAGPPLTADQRPGPVEFRGPAEIDDDGGGDGGI